MYIDDSIMNDYNPYTSTSGLVSSLDRLQLGLPRTSTPFSTSIFVLQIRNHQVNINFPLLHSRKLLTYSFFSRTVYQLLLFLPLTSKNLNPQPYCASLTSEYHIISEDFKPTDHPLDISES